MLAYETKSIIRRRDAKALGLKTYFTGKPCKHGHIDNRFVYDGGCNTCKLQQALAWKKRNQEHCKQYSQGWHLANADHSKAYRKRKYAENPQKELEKCHKWQRENAARMKATNKKWREANKERCQIIQLEWRAKNIDKVKENARQWRLKNLRRRAIDEAKRRALKRGCDGSHTIDDVKSLLEKQHFKCAWCNKSVRKEYHVDHIMPLSLGGSNDKRNIQILCPTCNIRKHANHPIDWARKNGRLL